MTTETLGEEPGVIVTSDHGESLFEEGTLGHGFLIDDPQTKVPLIVTKIPMRIAQPWSQSALRRELVDALAGSNSEPGQTGPVVRHEQPGEVFQYLGNVDGPAEIGLRSDAGQTLSRFQEPAQSGRRWGVGAARGTVAEPPRQICAPDPDLGKSDPRPEPGHPALSESGRTASRRDSSAGKSRRRWTTPRRKPKTTAVVPASPALPFAKPCNNVNAAHIMIWNQPSSVSGPR
jgi:hypothetical protein